MSRQKASFKERGEYLLLAFCVFFFKFAPLFLLRYAERLLLFFLCRPGRRHAGIVDTNLRTAFPEKPLAEIGELRRDVYTHFIRIFIEDVRAFARRDMRSLLQRAQLNGLEILQEVLGRGQGAILFTAHFGNWELIPALLRERSTRPIFGVVRRMDNPLVERLVLEFRRFMGAEVIYKRGSLRAMLEKLGQNSLVVMLIDQNTVPQEGVFVNFFARPAATTPSIAHLHLKKKIPLVPIFVHYDRDAIVLDIFPEVAFCESADFERDRLDLTQQLTAMIEGQIRRHPEQWLWFHNRWKTRPPGESNEKRKQG